MPGIGSGFFRLEGEFGFEVHVKYSVVKLWELSPEPFLVFRPALPPSIRFALRA